MSARSVRAGRGFAAGVAALLLLSGCAAAEQPAAERVTVADAWVKAVDEGMTAAFATVDNASDTAATIVSATSAAAATVELHETVADDAGQMTMREKEGGLVVPAAGELLLEPGGTHLMLMGVTAPLRAGDEVTIVLTFADGSSTPVTAAVKDYAGADENYSSDDAHG